jgi:integrase
MPRKKKEVLKKRADGRYRTVYRGVYFYGHSSDEAIAAREVYKELESSGELARANGPTLESFAMRWIKNAKPNVMPQTKTEAQIHLNKLIERYGFYALSDIKPSDIKTIYSEDYANLSDSYIKAASRLYKSLFDSAVEDGYCKINPARMKSAQPHKGYEKKRKAITPEEREWILTYCHDHKLYPAVMAMLYAGLRPPEAKALNIDKAYNPKTMTITLTEFIHTTGSNKYEVTSKGKTDKSVRTIPVFLPLENALKGKHGLLVPTRDGNIVTISAWRSLWSSYLFCMETAINGCEKRWYGKTKEHKRILAEGGKLPPWKEFKIQPYQLRHSFCVFCRDHGVELNTCVSWMGHKDAKMILKVYDEVSADRSYMEAIKLQQTVFQGHEKGQAKEQDCQDC